jgi:hypothetical protein
MKKNAQRGISLLEALGSLAIGSMMLMSMTAMIDSSLDETKGQRIALHQAQVANAARKYISANYTDLVAATAGGTVGTITVAQLKTGGFLSDNFSSTNAFNQTACVLVRQPTSGKLDALVATYGGQAIPERDIPLVAMYAGQGGGYISTEAPGTARGASWELVTTDYRNVACGGTTVLTGAAANDGGHLVSSLFYDGPGQLSTDFLYRDAVPGRPELNQLNTPITLAGNALVTPGAACGSKAAFGMDDATRSLLACGTDGLWKAVSGWKEPVLNHGDLPASGNSIGDVRMVTALGRAFSYNGSGWVALAVDEAGNMDVPGALSADSVAATTQITTDGSIAAAGDIRAENTITGKGVQGDWVSGKYWVEGQSLYVNQPVAAGDPCNIHFVNPDGTTGVDWAIGTIKRDVNGILLTCAWDSVFRYQNGSTTPPY